MVLNKEGESISNVVLLQSLMYYYYNFILQVETGYHKWFFMKSKLVNIFMFMDIKSYLKLVNAVVAALKKLQKICKYNGVWLWLCSNKFYLQIHSIGQIWPVSCGVVYLSKNITSSEGCGKLQTLWKRTILTHELSFIICYKLSYQMFNQLFEEWEKYRIFW